MAASSSLMAAPPNFCCPRRPGVTPLRSYNLKETRKYRASSKRYFQRVDQKASLSIIYQTAQFRCKAATMEITLANETLLTGEEAVITAAAAEAVALARAALEAAKEAVQLSEITDFSIKPAPQTLALESVLPLTEKSFQNPFDESTVQIEEKLTSLDDNVEVTVRSIRQDERRARRQRAAEKMTGTVIPVGSGARKKKSKRSGVKGSKDDPLKLYKRIAGAYKPLTMAEEKLLSEGVQDLLRLEEVQKELREQNGEDPSFAMWAEAAHIDQRTLQRRLEYGTRCKEKMIRCNTRLVVSIAKNYMGAGLAFEDLVQEGCRGLVKGVEKFDASKGFKFSTYAHWWIKQAIRKSLTDSSRLIHLPLSLVNASYRVKDAMKELKISGRKMKEQRTEEIASVAGVSKQMVKKVLMIPKTPQSFESKIGADKNMKLSDVIQCREQDSLEFIINREFNISGINMVLDTLSAREKTVVRGRFGLDNGRAKTLQEIGDIIGISRERVRQIELCALRKLKGKKRMDMLLEYTKHFGS
ncbi:RNApolymerase sigma subunit 2 [Carex rostrata]